MKWQLADVENWYNEQSIKRFYKLDVLSKIQKLESKFEVSKYGSLSQDPERYPLYILKSKKFDRSKNTILITGGVHGYETSGIHGALAFLDQAVHAYEDKFNFVCTPCISPWAYETINRWNAKAIDPNRSFYKDSPAEECMHFLNATKDVYPFAHFDLHETTDTDNTIFRLALEQRDGVAQEFSPIPDGFYLVGDADNPKSEFQKAIIDSVRKVTHIAPADESGKIIGKKIEQEGVVNYQLKKLFLCAGAFSSEYNTTTEVYPDSPKVNDKICVDAQVAAITGGLDYLMRLNK
jgi:hypothetical protein